MDSIFDKDFVGDDVIKIDLEDLQLEDKDVQWPKLHTKTYYELLQVSRSATSEEIASAWKKLSLLFHEDKLARFKYSDPKAYAYGMRMQQLINEAKTVLLDPRRRAIYDVYGDEGVEALRENQHRTEDEIDGLLAKKKKEEAVSQLREKLRVRGSSTFSSVCFDEAADPMPPLLGAGSMRQIFQNRLDSKNRVELGLYLASSVYNASAIEKTVYLEYLRTLAADNSKHVSVALLTQGQFVALQFGGQMRVWEHSVVGFATGYTSTGNFLKLHLQEPITSRTSMLAKLHMMSRGSVFSLHAVHAFEGKDEANSPAQLHSALTFSPVDWGREFPFPYPSLGLKLHARISKKARLKFGTELKPFETRVPLAYSVGYTRKISKTSKVGFKVGTDPSGEVFISFMYQWLGQRFNFPFLVAPGLADAMDETHLPIFLGSLFAPLAVLVAANLFWLRPYKALKKERRNKRRAQAARAVLAVSREEGEQAQQLLRAGAERRKRQEDEIGGLVIIDAEYGYGSQQIDVSVPLQYMVENSSLVLPPRSKLEIAGFWDPCPDNEKRLKITYLFNGISHTEYVRDSQPVKIPIPDHKNSSFDATDDLADEVMFEGVD